MTWSDLLGIAWCAGWALWGAFNVRRVLRDRRQDQQGSVRSRMRILGFTTNIASRNAAKAIEELGKAGR